MYGVTQVPSDTYLREMLDPIETRYLRKFFTPAVCFCSGAPVDSDTLNILMKAISHRLMERGISVLAKFTAQNAVLKKPDSKNPQYYHQLLACCLVKPGKKEVLPLMPETDHSAAGCIKE